MEVIIIVTLICGLLLVAYCNRKHRIAWEEELALRKQREGELEENRTRTSNKIAHLERLLADARGEPPPTDAPMAPDEEEESEAQLKRIREKLVGLTAAAPLEPVIGFSSTCECCEEVIVYTTNDLKWRDRANYASIRCPVCMSRCYFVDRDHTFYRDEEEVKASDVVA